MVPVYTVDSAGRDAVARALDGVDWSPVESPEEFRAIARFACAAVIAPGDLSDTVVAGWLHPLLAELPHVEWVLLCPFTIRNVDEILRLRAFAGVVWLHEAERMLLPMVTDLLKKDGMACIEKALASDSRIPAELRYGLVRACRLKAPPRTVGGLCRAVGIGQSRLRYLWLGCMRKGVTPAELRDWLLLAWAVRFRAEGEAWEKVARRLGVTEGRLRAMMERRTGKRPGQLAGKEAGVLRAEFARWWMRARAG